MAWSRRIRRKPIENYALRKIDTQRSTLPNATNYYTVISALANLE